MQCQLRVQSVFPVEFYVSNMKLKDYFFQILVFWPLLSELFTKPSTASMSLSKSRHRCVWLCAQLSRSKSPQSELLTSS